MWARTGKSGLVLTEILPVSGDSPPGTEEGATLQVDVPRLGKQRGGRELFSCLLLLTGLQLTITFTPKWPLLGARSAPFGP